MQAKSLFRVLPSASSTPAATTVIQLNGAQVEVLDGVSLAAALLAVGPVALRANPAAGAIRGPYCMMGVCFECLVQVDGVPNVQSCMVPVRAGMEVNTFTPQENISSEALHA